MKGGMIFQTKFCAMKTSKLKNLCSHEHQSILQEIGLIQQYCHGPLELQFQFIHGLNDHRLVDLGMSCGEVWGTSGNEGDTKSNEGPGVNRELHGREKRADGCNKRTTDRGVMCPLARVC
jgi:hypothetical protein